MPMCRSDHDSSGLICRRRVACFGLARDTAADYDALRDASFRSPSSSEDRLVTRAVPVGAATPFSAGSSRRASTPHHRQRSRLIGPQRACVYEVVVVPADLESHSATWLRANVNALIVADRIPADLPTFVQPGVDARRTVVVSATRAACVTAFRIPSEDRVCDGIRAPRSG